MRLLLPTLLFTLFLFLTACGNKSEKQMEQTDISLIKDSLSSGQAPADTTLAAIVPIIEKELNAWIKSFNGFSAESFKYTQTTKIEETANLHTGDWKRIAFFGPSAGIEEATWISATEFVLAGIIRNDNGDPMPFLLWGDAQRKSIRWFEASIIRPQSVNYEASGLAKLKIDEWE